MTAREMMIELGDLRPLDPAAPARSEWIDKPTLRIDEARLAAERTIAFPGAPVRRDWARP